MKLKIKESGRKFINTMINMLLTRLYANLYLMSKVYFRYRIM